MTQVFLWSNHIPKEKQFAGSEIILSNNEHTDKQPVKVKCVVEKKKKKKIYKKRKTRIAKTTTMTTTRKRLKWQSERKNE